jgi:hypothetical protein
MINLSRSGWDEMTDAALHRRINAVSLAAVVGLLPLAMKKASIEAP